MRNIDRIGALAFAASLVMTSSGCGSEPTSSGTGGEGGKPTGGSGTGASATGTGGSGAGTGVSASAAGDLVISEIMNNPALVQDNSGEWFEVHNPTNNAIDLAGLVLDDGVGTHTIASSVVVPSKGYAVLGLNKDAATNGGVAVDYGYDTIKFANATGSLTIRTTLVTIDTTAYDEASGLDPDGASRSLDPGFLSASANDTDAHWCAATSFINGSAGDKGTPGKANDACP